jgi:endonuclease YncB( thermonuclease family)
MRTAFVLSWLMGVALAMLFSHQTLADGCALRSVVDGDTVRIDCGSGPIRARLACIDAPELAQQPYGLESRQRLASLTRSEVAIRTGDPDRYGRPLVWLYSGPARIEVNLEMVASGNAAVYRAYCQDERFALAEQSARNGRFGIWEKDGLQQTPWLWRSAADGR